MKTIAAVFLLILLIPLGQGATTISTSGGGGSCDHYYHAAIFQVASVISAGDLEVWGGAESCGYARLPTDTIRWVGRASGPPILTPAGLTTITWAAQDVSGCTFSSFDTLNDVFTGATGSSTDALITMTSNHCSANVLFTLTLTNALMITLFQNRVKIPVDIRVDPASLYVFNCGATGTTTNAADPDTSTCNDPEQTVTCIDCTDTVTIGDTNVTVNVQANLTGNLTGGSGNQTTAPGFDGSLYVLLTAVGIALAHVGGINRANGPRILGGAFVFAGSLAIFRELERLGFNHMEESTISMALLVMAIQWVAAVALMIPKDYEEEQEETE